MQVLIWIIIILVVVFLIWFLKRWIKRIIFIMILFALAFFIYGIFSPSGASRLWYNVKTFPQRVTSWISSGSEFLDYDRYKLDISSVGDKIDLGEEKKDSDLDSGTKNESDNNESYDGEDKEKQEIKSENTEDKELSNEEDIQTIKSFPKSASFVELVSVDEEVISKNFGPFEGYSKVDLLGIINKYIEKNLDDDTDILVTVEYEEGNKIPQKIILKTQQKTKHSLSDSNKSDDKSSHNSSSEKDISVEKLSNNEVINDTQNSEKTTSTKLTQKDQQDADEIFSILF